jgi:signal transduction histidine kinase/ligand-binding sensor domain-containing protein
MANSEPTEPTATNIGVSPRRSGWGNSLRCFHRRRMQRKLKFQPTALCAVVIMIATCRALALDPAQPTDSYLRKNFTIEDGLPANEVHAILQTQNGFLWVGTDAGLARFNGQRFTPINIGLGVAQQIPVRSLLTTQEGDLWVGTDAGLARISSAALDHFDRALVTMYHVGVGQSDQILCIHRSRAGTLWVGTGGGLYRFDRGNFISTIPHDMISRIEESSDGHLLIITGHGFVEWDGARIIPHPEIAQQLGVSTNSVFHVFEDHEGATWFCTGAGVARRVGGRITRIEPYGLPRGGAWRVYEDPQGTIWVVAQLGLFRASATGLEPLLSSLDSIQIAYADREGDLWVSVRNEGLVRFKDRAVRMYTTFDGLPNNRTRTVLRSHNGTLWVGNNCGGISRFDGRRFQNYNEKDGLSNSCVWAMAEDTEQNLWIGTWGGGLYRFRDGHFTQYSNQQGLPSIVVVCIVAAPDGSLWIATDLGLSHMQNGHFRNYSVADGLSSDLIRTVYQDRSGTIWVGTSVGVDRLVGDRFVTVSRDARSSNALFRTLREDSSGDLYAFSEVNGISRLKDNRLVSVNETLASGNMIESAQHDLWFCGRQGIFRVAAGGLRHAEQDRESPLDYSSFGPDDGMNSKECDGWGQPNMAMTSDDTLWVATVKGLAKLDRQRFQRTNHKPAIYMEEVDVGRTKASPTRELVLPPGTYHVEFHFSAVDLVSPEKIRLQYRLDGVDPLWLDADSTRTGIYNSIPVGAHSFHIRACNRDGVWDRDGIVYSVIQQPFLYETTWFRLSAVAVIGLLVAGIFRLRVRRIAHEFNVRLEERLTERTRIARDLHDSLLQGFQGLIFRFQAVREFLPGRPNEATEALDIALKRADKVIVEGRDTVSDLRQSVMEDSDIGQALTALGEELAAQGDSGTVPCVRVLVEGKQRNLDPMLRDEIYSIGREALRNAFRHAQAQKIEAQITYGDSEFVFDVRDDGIGIAAAVADRGARPGHWGLPGMRERAKSLGGKLEVWSEHGAGTEIELIVPAAIAYGGSNARPRFWFLRKKIGVTDGKQS